MIQAMLRNAVLLKKNSPLGTRACASDEQPFLAPGKAKVRVCSVTGVCVPAGRMTVTQEQVLFATCAYYSTLISCHHLRLLESSLRVATLCKPPIKLVKPQTTADLEERADEGDSLGGREQLNEEARFNGQLT